MKFQVTIVGCTYEIEANSLNDALEEVANSTFDELVTVKVEPTQESKSVIEAKDGHPSQ